MNKKYVALIIIFITPLFFVKSSNITFKENYEEIGLDKSEIGVEAYPDFK